MCTIVMIGFNLEAAFNNDIDDLQPVDKDTSSEVHPEGNPEEVLKGS